MKPLKELKKFINKFECYIHKDDLLNHISKIESEPKKRKVCKFITEEFMNGVKVKVSAPITFDKEKKCKYCIYFGGLYNLLDEKIKMVECDECKKESILDNNSFDKFKENTKKANTISIDLISEDGYFNIKTNYFFTDVEKAKVFYKKLMKENGML